MFAGERVRPDQHVNLRVASNHVMKRAAVRRGGARPINLSDDSVRTLVVRQEQLKEIFPLPRSEEDIVVDRENVFRSGLSGEYQPVTRLCSLNFIS